MPDAQTNVPDTFQYHSPDAVEAMSLEEVEQLWDMVPTEDRDYLLRRYRQLLKQNNISSDEQEIRLAEELLRRYQYEGLVPAGNQWVRINTTRRQQFRRGETATAAITEDDNQTFSWTNLLIAGFGIFLLIFAVPRLLGNDEETVAVVAESTVTATPTATATLTPSPLPTITPIPTATPIALVESDQFISAGDGRNREFFPVQLQVLPPDSTQPRVFVVQERAVELTEWEFDPNPDVASWISGTMIRPVFGIPYTPSTDEFLRSLTPGTQFIIRMNTGSELIYQYQSGNEISRENTAAFRQNTPGIVLVSIGEMNESELPTSERYIITGAYDSDSEINLNNFTSLPATTGNPADIGQLRLTVDQSYLTSISENSSNDFLYLMIHMTLQTGLEEIHLDSYRWVLEAGGTRYSPDFSRSDYDDLPQILSTNETISTSLAFLVNPFDEEALLQVESPENLYQSFLISPEKPQIQPSIRHLDIQLREVRQQNDRIIVETRIYNGQNQPVTLQEDDIGMIFGFTENPAGPTVRPVNFNPVVFEADSWTDLTWDFSWNADDPFAALHLAGYVWTINLVNDT